MSQHSSFEYVKSAETVSAEMEISDVLFSLEHDARFFIQFFLGEELLHPIPDFHLDAWELLVNFGIPYAALALPRGHAKTTLMKLACVYHFLFSPTSFIVYLSNTHTIAAEACKDIIQYIRSDNFVAVFGVAIFDTEQESNGFYRFRISVHTPSGPVEKTCILRALGASQQVRGINVNNTRPELAIVDDLEDEENTGTEAQQKKLNKWFYGTFVKALTRNRPKILYAGNMLSAHSILYYIVTKSPRWHSMRFGCLKSDGTPLWPEIWTLEAIREDFVEHQRLKIIARWFAEMMNMPIAEGGGLIESGDIPYATPINPGEHEAAFITIDPAISKETWGNDCAIVVHALRNGVWIIAEYIVGKYDAGEIFQLIVMLCQKWRTRAVGIEAAGFQKVLKFVFETLMIVHNQSFSVHMIPHKNRSKTERLLAWCAVLKKHIWTLQEGDYAVTEQLLTYDPLKSNNVDDLIDACSMGVTMQELYLSEIMQYFQFQQITYDVKRGVETMSI